MDFDKKRLSLLVTFLFPSLCFLFLFGCNPSKDRPELTTSYVSEIQEWHKTRIRSLSRKNGWLSLVGLYWLKGGENSFGADPSNDIIFPAGEAPGFVGAFILTGGEVSVRINSDVQVLREGEPVRVMVLQNDVDGDPTVLTLGPLSWFIIKRDEQFAVRLRDSDSPRVSEFKGIETFPIDPAWRIEATVEPYDPPKTVPVPTILGTVSKQSSPGSLVFKVQDKTYRLDPIGEPDDQDWFVIFADETNGEKTYGAGRYLYVERPDRDGTTIIDFNKSYNPPCAFTDFATCPLPPAQNRLPIEVTAGEKKYLEATH